MERREQVFVSSTFLDLQDERQAVIQTLLQADCLPAGMELFPASDDEKWDLIKRVIDDSDYYVVVIGGRYGSVDKEDGLSFTEKEFDYATSTGKPVMGFIHGSPGDLPQSKVDLDEDAREALAAFIEKVERRMVKRWTSAESLAGAVALSLIQTRKTHPAEGWVRASRALTPEVERELAELRAQVATLKREAQEHHALDVDLAEDAQFAQGEDEYLLPAFHFYWTKKDAEQGNRYESRARTVFHPIPASWALVFSELAPLMLNEASETDLDARLDVIADDLADHGDIEPSMKDFGQWWKSEAGSEAIQEVKVQFFALGLIEESEKRHPVNDKNHSWSLTERGRHQLMRSRAQRRPVAEPAPS